VAAIFHGKSVILIAATMRVGLIQVLDPHEGNGGLKNILILIVLAALAWFGYGKYQAAHSAAASGATAPRAGGPPLELADQPEGAASPFKCDGRTMCPQMTSCAEATYFIQHCPNTKMDGTMTEFLASVSGATNKGEV
jgi:hypothetical protein